MPRIPRLEQTQKIDIAAQPSMSPDALTGPGRALQQLGSSIGSLAGAFGDQQSKEDDFNAKLQILKFSNDVDMANLEHQASYTGDGEDYVPTVQRSYDTKVASLYENIPQSQMKKAQLFVEQKRGSVYEGAYRQATGIKHAKMFSAAGAAVAEEFGKMAGVPPEQFESGFQGVINGVNAIIDTTPFNEEQRERLRARAAQIADDLLTKAIPAGGRRQAVDALIKQWSTEKAAPAPGPQSSFTDPKAYLKTRLAKGYESRTSDIDNLHPVMQDRLAALTAAAEAAGHDVRVISGHRGPERQKVLWENALKKYGSADEARKHVAPPGGSSHQSGEAVDLQFGDRGAGLGGKRTAAVDWVHKNAAKYGLHFPLGHEDWHIEPVEARAGGKRYGGQYDTGKKYFTGALGGPAPGAAGKPAGQIAVSSDGRIDPVSFATTMEAKVASSALNGQVPPWGKQFGITTGAPREWARFFTMVQQQESGHRIAERNPDGSLKRFATTPKGEQSFGPGQFKPGDYGLKSWDDVNNPDKVANAYIEVAKKGKLFEYFGSLQRPEETLRHAEWYDKEVASKLAGNGPVSQRGLTRVAGLDPSAGVQPPVPVTGQAPPSKITETLKGTPEEKAQKLRDLVAQGYQDIVHQLDANGNDVIVAKQADKPNWQRGRSGTDAEGRIPNELDNDQFAGPAWAKGVVSDIKAGKIERKANAIPGAVQTADTSGTVPRLRPSVESKLVENLLKKLPAIQAQDEAAVRSMVERAEKSASEGYKLPDNESVAIGRAVAAVGNQQLAQRYALAQQTAAYTAQLQTARPDEIQSLAIKARGEMAAAGKTATPEQIARVETLEKLAKHTNTELDKDMLAHGQRVGVIPTLQKIDPADLSLEVLQERANAARVMAERYGRNPQFFTSEEREMLTQAFKEGGEPLVQRLGLMAEAFGGDMPHAMAEIAKDVPEAATLGWLIYSKGDPQAIKDLADAVALKASGDKSYAAYAVSDVNAAFAARNVLGNALVGMPSVQKRVLDLASALYQVKAYRKGIDPKIKDLDAKLWKESVEAVIGKTTDPRSKIGYGGTYEQGGIFSSQYGQTVIVPPNVRTDKFPELIASIKATDLIKGGVPALPSGMAAPEGADVQESAAGSAMMSKGVAKTPVPNIVAGTPLDEKGRPISVTALQTMTLVSVGDGKYMIAQGDPKSDAPRFVVERGPDGALREYVLDLKAHEPVLKQRRPDLYRPD